MASYFCICINLYFIMVPYLRKSTKVWYSKAQLKGFWLLVSGFAAVGCRVWDSKGFIGPGV